MLILMGAALRGGTDATKGELNMSAPLELICMILLDPADIKEGRVRF
jgi:hypothetical protein